MNRNKKILYLFGEGRISRLNNLSESSDEFFYGYDYIKNIYQETSIIEMSSGKRRIIFSFIDKVLRKVTKHGFFLSHIFTLKNTLKIIKSDIVIATNDRIALSALPMLLIAKIFSKTKVLVIVMGLLSKEGSHNFLYKYTMKYFLRIVDEFFFLGKPESEVASKNYPEHSSKFHFIPFCINERFWTINQNLPFQQKNKIAFVGNDGNREFDKAINIAKSLPNINFIFVTQEIDKKDIPNNVELISGSWGDNTITDKEIKKIYGESRFTILPLRETIQPSGQSVTLQSISCGTPVLISKTKGFWDTDKYINKKNIIFIEDNSLKSWIEEIKSIYEDKTMLKAIAKNGISLIHEEYNKKVFEKALISFLD